MKLAKRLFLHLVTALMILGIYYVFFECLLRELEKYYGII